MRMSYYVWFSERRGIGVPNKERHVARSTDMRSSHLRSSIVLLLGLLSAMATPGTVQAQADVAGSWTLSVSTDNGVTSPSMTLEQDGSVLTGHYSSDALGDQDVSGTVDGNAVTISFDTSLQGQSVGVVYRGTLGDDGRLTGTIDIADGMLTGSFTATRNAP